MAKNKKHTPLDAILFAGEHIVWQGKPNATTLEYVAQQTPASPSAQPKQVSVIDFLTERLLSFYDVERRHKVWDTPIAFFSSLAGLVSGTWLVMVISQWMPDLGGMLSGIAFFIGIVILAPLIYVLSTWVTIFILSKLFSLIETVFWRVIEGNNATYIITNQRVIVYTSRWMYRYVFNNAIHHAVINQSREGSRITWFEYRNDDAAIPPFMGLSDFDLKHVLATVDEQINTNFYVTDARGKAKMK